MQKKGVQKFCILGSDSTLKSRLYQKKLKMANIDNYFLSSEQQFFINKLIVKGVSTENIQLNEIKEMQLIIKEIKKNNVEAAVFACTDFSAVFNKNNLNIDIFDSNECLAEAAVRECLVKINKNRLTSKL